MLARARTGPVWLLQPGADGSARQLWLQRETEVLAPLRFGKPLSTDVRCCSVSSVSSGTLYHVWCIVNVKTKIFIPLLLREGLKAVAAAAVTHNPTSHHFMEVKSFRGKNFLLNLSFFTNYINGVL